jgi:hypothetical protein
VAGALDGGGCATLPQHAGLSFFIYFYTILKKTHECKRGEHVSVVFVFCETTQLRAPLSAGAELNWPRNSW